MRHRLFCSLLLAAAALPAAADDIDRLDQVGQVQFRQLSQDLTAIVSYKAVATVEALGIIGFDIGFEVSATELEHRDAWNQASSGSAPQTVYMPKVHLHKGLPAGFDIGASWGTVSDSNIDMFGAEIRYALIDGGVLTPAVGLRGAYSKLSGVDQLDISTRSLDIGVSKGFAFFTPYAGVGRVWTEANPGVANLATEKFSDDKVYLGANINFVAGNLALEADRVGDTLSYSVKFGFRF